MFTSLGIALKEHLRDRLLLYLLVIVFLTLGIAVGTFSINLLTLEESVELTQYLASVLGVVEEADLDFLLTFKETTFKNIKTLVLIWFLGLTVLGMPLIFLLISSKGFVLGFTAGFLIKEQSIQGILLSFLTLVLPNIFILPALIIASVMGISFSIWLVKGRQKINSTGFGQQFIIYSLTMFVLFFIILIGSILEVYCSSYLLKAMIGLFNL